MAANPSKIIVILTGAGISAESGLSTFRDSNGLWENHKVEDVATPEAYSRDPQLVWRFYSMRRIQASLAQPNLAHKAIVEFSKQEGYELHLITQNVDVLHERADTNHRIETICMHGSLNQSRCSSCDTIYFDDYAYFNLKGDYAPQQTELCNESQRASTNYLHHYKLEYRNFLPISPCCKEPIRPNIVWFGEVPHFLEKIIPLLQRTDLFLTIGTSGVVYPAAGFIEVAKRSGARTVCINQEPIPQNHIIDEFIQGSAGEKVPEFFERLKKST